MWSIEIEPEGIIILIISYVIIISALWLNIYANKGIRNLKKEIDEDYEKYKSLIKLYGGLVEERKIKTALRYRLMQRLKLYKIHIRSVYYKYRDLLNKDK